MLRVKILICKLSNLILKRLGRGTSYPGWLALKLDKNILSKLEPPKTTICVTGTTGKTSICEILTDVYRQNGVNAKNNSKGSNLIAGVTTLFIDNCKLNGKTKADVFVLEVDERYVKEVFKYFKPNYFVVNNLSRDQLARNGHSLLVWNEINRVITDDIHLILNADDPLMYMLSLNHKGKISYFGLGKTKYSAKESDYNLDISYCPVCHSKLKFDFFHFGNIGSYSCPKCSFKRPKVKYESELLSSNSFKINNNTIKMANDALYNVYNLSASYVMAKESKLKDSGIVKALNNLNIHIKRLDTYKVNNKDVTLLLSKNEVPISYNQSLEYISDKKEDKTLVIGFERISGRYDLKDISWIYDINFETLKNKNITKIITVGPFASDLAVRLKYALVDEKIIEIIYETNDVLNIIKTKTIGKVYCLVYFDIFYKLKDALKSEVVK